MTVPTTYNLEGFDFNSEKNLIPFPHRGRHPKKYHQWVYSAISKELKGNKGAEAQDDLDQLLERLAKKIGNNPLRMRAIGWDIKGQSSFINTRRSEGKL